MSIKDNFNQAIKEIFKKDGIIGEKSTQSEQTKSELDRYIDPVGGAVPTTQENFDTLSNRAEMKPETRREQTVNNFSQPSPPTFDTISSPPQPEPVNLAQPSQPTPKFAENFGANVSDFTKVPENPTPIKRESIFEDVKFNEGASDETTVISRNTVIDGNIRSFANVTIEGNVKGNVQLTKNAVLTGKLVGDLECNNAAMAGSQVQGTVTSKGQVKFDRESLILGDVNAQYLDMNGKVKGNIDVAGKADFRTDAYIIGNITASTLTVSEGATISGHVNTTFLQENSESVFPDAIMLGE